MLTNKIYYGFFEYLHSEKTTKILIYPQVSSMDDLFKSYFFSKKHHKKVSQHFISRVSLWKNDSISKICINCMLIYNNYTISSFDDNDIPGILDIFI